MTKWIVTVLIGWVGIVTSAPGDQTPMPPKGADCSTLSPAMQQFAQQLTPGNQAVFCGKFTDAQRAQAMQVANQVDPSGKPLMSADQAVQKVAFDTGVAPLKTPGGCPVK
jgi:hypothetical protein